MGSKYIIFCEAHHQYGRQWWVADCDVICTMSIPTPTTSPETIYYGEDALLFIAYVMLVWAAYPWCQVVLQLVVIFITLG